MIGKYLQVSFEGRAIAKLRFRGKSGLQSGRMPGNARRAQA